MSKSRVTIATGTPEAEGHERRAAAKAARSEEGVGAKAVEAAVRTLEPVALPEL